jgi:hypothetical protein
MEALTEGLEKWKSFSDGTNTFVAVGSDLQIFYDGATGQTAVFHPQNANGTVNMDITQELFGKKYTYFGDPKVYTLPLLATYDGVHRTLRVQPAQEASASKDRRVWEILQMGSDGKVYDSGSALVLQLTPDGVAFSIQKGTALASTLAIGDSGVAKPRTAVPYESVDVVFHLSGNGPSVVPSSTVEVPTAIPTITPTPEPKKELRPGIDGWVIAETTELKFSYAYMTDYFADKELTDASFITESDKVTFLIVKADYRGDPSPYMDRNLPVFNSINNNVLLYVEGQSGLHFGGFLAFYAGTASKGKFAFLFRISKNEKGPFILRDDYHHWQVDLSSILQVPATPSTP